MTTEEPTQRHPTDGELAAYLGRELRGEALREVESHLARCPVCREEVMDASEILATGTGGSWTRLGYGLRRGRRILAPLVAAAAALVLYFSLPGGEDRLPVEPGHRETPDEPGSAPALVSPLGATQDAGTFVWRRVSGADRYRLTLFEANGAVLWRGTTSDSLTSLPDSVILTPGRSYLWQVEARIGWDLWEASDLLEFRLAGDQGREPDWDDEAPSGAGGAQ